MSSEVTIPAQRAATSWGEWSLGDLADALQKVSRLVGPGFPLVTASVYPPTAGESLPSVQLVVPDRLRLESVKATVSSVGALLVPADAGEYANNFHAVVDDVLLCVWTRG